MASSSFPSFNPAGTVDVSAGGGKTVLKVIFNTGAAQTIATQP